jgi:hypothetical protein
MLGQQNAQFLFLYWTKEIVKKLIFSFQFLHLSFVLIWRIHMVQEEYDFQHF